MRNKNLNTPTNKNNMQAQGQQLFTIVVYSEHCVGLLNQVSIIFTRRCLNLEDVTASPTSVPGVHRLTISTWSDRESMEKVVKQIEKRIDVLRAYLYTDDDIIYQEIALFKINTEALLREQHLESIIRHHNARILDITPTYVVMEKAGQPWETQALLEQAQALRRAPVCAQRTHLCHQEPGGDSRQIS